MYITVGVSQSISPSVRQLVSQVGVECCAVLQQDGPVQWDYQVGYWQSLFYCIIHHSSLIDALFCLLLLSSRVSTLARHPLFFPSDVMNEWMDVWMDECMDGILNRTVMLSYDCCVVHFCSTVIVVREIFLPR